jgi:2-oxoglutarate ferredoxin oxidoreductase subunit beta
MRFCVRSRSWPRLSASIVGGYRTDYTPSWCPGCGDYGVLKSLDMAFHELGLRNEEIVVISGIGCNGRFPHSFKTYGFHTLHGRVLPIAQGINITRPELCVVGVAGDGDAFAIGGGHVPHAARRNPDITYIVLDNGIYGQTKGQPSPTTPIGYKTKVTPDGIMKTRSTSANWRLPMVSRSWRGASRGNRTIWHTCSLRE